MNRGWPAGDLHYPYEELPNVLIDGSSLHARLAHELYPGEAGWDAQRLAISIGTAVELLLKNVLARQSFHLLTDKYSNETALTLDGKGTASAHLPQLTTVAGLAAFDRVNKLCGLQLKKDDFELIFQVRNSAAHLGVASVHTNKAAFRQMVLLTDRLFTYLGSDTPTRIGYWGGEDAESFVRAIVDEAISEVRVKYEQLVRRAKVDYQKLSLSLIEAGKAEVIRQFAEVPPTIDVDAEEASPHQCPACENMGWVVYEVSRSIPFVEHTEDEFRYELGDAYVEREGSAVRFECGVCRLKLDRRDYLVEAGIALETDLDPDDATPEEIDNYESAQVDSYIDSMIDERRGK